MTASNLPNLLSRPLTAVPVRTSGRYAAEAVFYQPHSSNRHLVVAPSAELKTAAFLAHVPPPRHSATLQNQHHSTL